MSMLCLAMAVRMIQPDVPVVLLDPGLNRTAGLINAYLTTFTGDAADANSFYVMSC